MQQPRKTDVIIDPLSPAEIQQVFSAFDPNTAPGARNKAIISLFLHSGLRRSELAGLMAEGAHPAVSFSR
jgi:site-specific recombinase XerD